MIQELFKTPIYTTPLSLDNTAISKYCISYSKKNKGRHLSNEGGWQSQDLTGKHSTLDPLLHSILEHGSIFSKDLDIKMVNQISNIWINVNGYKDMNMVHSHPNSLLSGVYYVQTPKDCGNIQFQHPAFDKFQYDWLESKGEQFNTYNSGEWWLQSITGVMYIFPSWLKHRVRPNLNKKEKRISISFNLI